MKWSLYNALKALLLVLYGVGIGVWSIEAIDPFAIVFRIIVGVSLMVLWTVIWAWFEDGINIRKKLE